MPTPKLHILCVDNDDDTAELITMMLRQANSDYEVNSVRTPDEALTLAATKEIDLYVLDYRFPDVSGIEICKRIREADPDTRIMFFTGEARDRERQEALNDCADAYLVKPLDIDKLTKTAERLLGDGRLVGV